MHRKNASQVFFIVIYSLAFILTALTFVLWVFNLQMVLNNFTSFEYNKLHKNFDFSFRNKVSYNKVDAYADFEEYESVKSPYDVGKLKNWTQVYGENPLLWFVPVRPKPSGAFGNGINFEQSDEEAFEIIKSI